MRAVVEMLERAGVQAGWGLGIVAALEAGKHGASSDAQLGLMVIGLLLGAWYCERRGWA